MADYSYKQTDPWTWTKVGQDDIEPILDLIESNYQDEIQGILTPNRIRMQYNLYKAVVEQSFLPNQTLLTIAKNKDDDAAIAWAWCERGKWTHYANEEMAVAEFAHVELSLSARTRVTLCAQILEQWITWTTMNNIPVLCSTTIRDDQKAFMRLHDHYGFSRRGSFAYKRIC